MSPLCSHTVQVPSGQVSKRRYRNKEHKLRRQSVDAQDLAGTVILDWLEEKYLVEENEVKAAKFRKIITSLETCGKNFVHLETCQGEIKLSRIHCNNEFCPICGQRDSALSHKRAGRALDRLIWSPILGYMVYTLPDEISKKRPGKEALKRLSKGAWEITKKHFDTVGGCVRTHLMGDTPGKFHHHFNVLFPRQVTTGAVPLETLQAIRSEWTDFVNKEFETGYKITNIYYKFAIETGRQIHKIKYVLRPIVTPDKFITLSEEDREYVISLKGWHNTRWFGKLANSQYKKYFKEIGVELAPDYEAVAPISGEKYMYMGIIAKADVHEGSFIDNDGHYNQIRGINNNTFVDLETRAFLKEFEKSGSKKRIVLMKPDPQEKTPPKETREEKCKRPELQQYFL